MEYCRLKIDLGCYGIWVFCPLLVFCFSATAQERPDKPTTRPHIAIVGNRTDHDFPAVMRLPPLKFHVEPYQYPDRLALITSALEGEFDKYPTKLLDENLKEIDLFENLWMYGVSLGGTYQGDPDTILLHVQQTQSDTFRVFHHEFSSLLLIRYFDAFDYDGWIALLPSGFQYHNAIDHTFTTHLDILPKSEWAEKGFASEYSTTSLEDDFNVIAQNLFLPFPQFWNFVDRYPQLKRKVGLVIKFYHTLDARYDEHYFRSFDVPKRK